MMRGSRENVLFVHLDNDDNDDDDDDFLISVFIQLLIFLFSFFKEFDSLTHIKSRTVSENPTTYIAAPRAFAAEKINPMAPPNSGPRLREIM